MGKKVPKPTYGPLTPASVAPDPTAMLEAAIRAEDHPDEFLFAHAIIARYTGPVWGSKYAVRPCMGCNQTGRIDTSTWAVVPAIEGMPFGTCPVCLGTAWQPTLGTCKLALAHARTKVHEWEQQATAYASEFAELELAAGRKGEVHSIVVRENGKLAHYEMKDIPKLQAKLEKLGKKALRNGGLCEYDVNAIERFADLVNRLRSHMKQEDRKAAQLAAPAPAPVVAKHDPRKVCNGYEQVKGKRKRCHRTPQEWDEAGKGWCRRHAHKRGLHKQEEVV